MAEQLKFMVYCAEIYKENKNLDGKQLSALFDKYGIWQYIYDCFDALHIVCSFLRSLMSLIEINGETYEKNVLLRMRRGYNAK